MIWEELPVLWDSIDKISGILGILTALPVGVAAINYLLKGYRARKIRHDVIKNFKGKKCAALVITIGAPSIATDVERFIRGDPLLSREFESEKSPDKLNGLISCHIERKMPTDSMTAVDKYIEEFFTKFYEIEKNLKENLSADRLHLFYLGPVAIMSMIADELSNRFTVLCYQYLNDPAAKKKYICLGPMHRMKS